MSLIGGDLIWVDDAYVRYVGDGLIEGKCEANITMQGDFTFCRDIRRLALKLVKAVFPEISFYTDVTLDLEPSITPKCFKVKVVGYRPSDDELYQLSMSYLIGEDISLCEI